MLSSSSSSLRAPSAAQPQQAHRRTPFVLARLPGAAAARRPVALARAEEQGKTQSTPTLMRSGEETDNCETNVSGEYCSIDLKGKRLRERSLGEMEAEFLEALSSYYYENKPRLSDEEFSLLKEELIWNGSKVATLDSNEQRFLEATMAYARGAPIMADADYDALKAELRAKASVVTAEGPRCSIRTKKMYSDAQPDYLRMTALNVPAATLVLAVLFALDDLTGFEITSILELPPPWGIVALWGLLLPGVFVLATSLTNLVLRDNLVLRAPCPNCGAENITYFGDILTVPGNRGVNVTECTGCRADISFDFNKRIVVVDKTPEEKAEAAAALAAKKAASAAKKAAAAARKAAGGGDSA